MKNNYSKIVIKLGRLDIEISLCLGMVFGIAFSYDKNITYISIGPFVITVKWEE